MNFASGLIDVFADTPLGGNPLAVVEGADALPDDTLRRIAFEFNQAETTFILKSTRAALSAHVNETVDPKQFTVEGDQGRADEDGA